MSLTSDVITYLTAAGHISEATWRGSNGIQSRQHDGYPQLIAVEDLTGIQAETHDDRNRGLGFRLMVRSAQHKYDVAREKFEQVFDALQDQVTAINATPGLGYTYNQVHSDNDGPIVSYDKMDRPHMTATFRVIVAKV